MLLVLNSFMKNLFIVKSSDDNWEFIKSTGLQTKQQHWRTFTNNQLQYHLLRGQSPYFSKYSISGPIKRTLCVNQTYFELSRFNQIIIRRDIAKRRFSIWRPSAILNLQNFGILLSSRPYKHNLHLHTKFR